MALELSLKRDWDTAPSLASSSPKGHFVGRKRELERIANELTRKAHGSYLVCGQRGVGKTALVFEAVNRAIDSGAKIIPVYVNATQLELDQVQDTPEKNTSGFAQKVLVNIIRRLYATTVRTPIAIPDEIKSDIADLYKKAAAAEYKAEENSDDTAQTATKNETSHQVYTQFVFDKAQLQALVPIASAAIASALITGSTLSSASQLVKLAGIICGLLVLIPIPAYVNYRFSRTQTKSQSNSARRSASHYYSYDNSLGNLEFDLEAIHHKTERLGHRIVYIIDELDKAPIGPAALIKVLGIFKPFLTQSSAAFIFVAHNDLFDVINTERSKKGPSFTFFTHIFFIQRARFQDIEDFIDEIIDWKRSKANKTDSLYRSYKNYLTQVASSDFFELYQAIRDSISNYDKDGIPVIQLEALTQEQLTRSRIQKALGLVFSKFDHSAPSMWARNELLLAQLYSTASFLLTRVQPESFSAPEGASMSDAAVRSFYSLLARYGALAINGVTATRTINNLEVIIHSYGWSGSVPKDFPSSLEFLTEDEQRFVKAHTNVFKRAHEIISLRNLQNEQPASEFSGSSVNFELIMSMAQGISTYPFTSFANQHQTAINKLTKQSPPVAMSRAELEEKIRQVNGAVDTIKRHYPTAIVNIIRDHLPELSTHTLPNNGALFSHLQELRNKLSQSSHSVIWPSKTNLSRQLIIGIDLDPEILKQAESELQASRETHRILTICTSPEQFEISRKIRAVSSINADDDLTASSAILKKLVEWMKAPPKKPTIIV